jgi:hypothetical protein
MVIHISHQSTSQGDRYPIDDRASDFLEKVDREARGQGLGGLGGLASPSSFLGGNTMKHDFWIDVIW